MLDRSALEAGEKKKPEYLPGGVRCHGEKANPNTGHNFRGNNSPESFLHARGFNKPSTEYLAREKMLN